MSLHSLANHLQSAGRGEDKVLVHMTPGEVNGLQSLAMAQGGSLTINPETGLPEAGILKSLLPMLAGGALTFFSGGALSPLAASMIVGGGTAAATGSLKKGLMAGLGAYGGAGMGAGLSSMAAPATAPAVSGLSPTVAANASTLGGTSPLAKVGAENVLTSADDVFMQGMKNVPTGYNPRTSVAFLDASKAAPPPVNVATTSVRPPADTYFDPSRAYNPSGSLSGSSEAAKVKGFGAQRDIYNKGLLGRKGDIVEVVDNPIVPHSSVLETSTNVPTAAPKPFKMPEGATGWSGNSSLGYKYYGPGGDEIGGAFPVRGNLTAAGARYTPSTATTSQPFAGGMKHVPSTSTAVDVSEQSISRPFTDKMAELGRGARASFGSVEGLKGLYAASEAAAPYGMYAGLGSTAYSMYDEKRQQMEDEARARAEANRGLIRPYTFDYGRANVSGEPYTGSAERTYFQPTYTAGTPYKAPGPEYAAKGGLMGLAAGGPVEEMAAMNAVGANTGYPMANLQTPMYSNPAMQRPEATNVIAPSADYGVSTYSGEPRFAKGGGTAAPESSGYTYDYNPNTMQFTQTGRPGATSNQGPFNLVARAMGFGEQKANEFERANNPTPSATPNGTISGGVATPMMQPTTVGQPFAPTTIVPAYQTPEQQLGLGGFYDMMNQQLGGYGGYAAGGGVSHLGDYSDGGRLLKGPGDGVSDSIPASIGNRQPARLADGEFVVPARIVSEIGNGSTEAGARKLYAMMDRVQRARRKTTGKNQVAANTKAERLLPV